MRGLEGIEDIEKSTTQLLAVEILLAAQWQAGRQAGRQNNKETDSLEGGCERKDNSERQGGTRHEEVKTKKAESLLSLRRPLSPQQRTAWLPLRIHIKKGFADGSNDSLPLSSLFQLQPAGWGE